MLKDPKKRKLYDKYGLEGLKNEHFNSGGFEDIFGMFFNRGGRRGQRSRKPKIQAIQELMKISLQQAFKGDNKKLKYSRKVLCTGCKGKGG